MTRTTTASPPVQWPQNLPPMPAMDFAEFGPVQAVALSRHQKIAGAYLSRNWAQIPHVTHQDEAVIDEFECYRKAESDRLGVRLSPLPLLIKAAVCSLQAFPRFNASLDADGETLILKQYFHIGIAVETANGLVVPVIRDADQKSIGDLAVEITDKSQRARDKGLPLSEMVGGCFTISSLGSIGGTGFTPIINAPEVAIMGITRSRDQVVLRNGNAVNQKSLPLSLSYDHRVLNGADAARFCRHFAEQLEQPESLGDIQ